MGELLPAFIAAMASCVTAGLSVAVAARCEHAVKRHLVALTGLAAGVLVALALMHIIPEAHALYPQSSSWVLVGFTGLSAVHVALKSQSEGDLAGDDPVRRSSASLFLVGIGLHSFLDGAIYAIAFSVEAALGMTAALGLTLHKLPEAVTAFGRLLRVGTPRRKAALIVFAASGVATPAGTLVCYPLLHGMSENVHAALLATAGGVLLYLGAVHLLPEVEKDGKAATLLIMAAGVLLVAGIGHLHDSK